jgi:hypothetical protein
MRDAEPVAETGWIGREITVDPTRRWTDTGIELAPGDVLSVHAAGHIRVGRNDLGVPTDMPIGPGGVSYCRAPSDFPAQGPCFGLIGRIGDEVIHEIGDGQDFTVREGGRLRLGVNEVARKDDRGSWLALVRVSRPTESVPAPIPLTPPAGAIFDLYPRLMHFTWKAVEGSAGYVFQVDASAGRGTSWYGDEIAAHPYYFTPNPSLDHEFVGAQPGRWRVAAIDDRGLPGPFSEWWTFEYLR